MDRPGKIVDVFLRPGDFCFGDSTTRIRTLLGSCVSITVWHPLLHIGGMCHYMLPSRKNSDSKLDGRYAEDAMKFLIHKMKQSGTLPVEYEVKMFGGGNMFPHLNWPAQTDVSSRNIERGRQLLKEYGLLLKAEHLGGYGHRRLIFDIWSGHVQVRHDREQELLAGKRG
ncbi:MAG: chemotaxis protein CheD [Pseudomonadota bacterium]|nr:chemotaxis protein CheD [Pseudomonadota bacterium]